jgi:hypothetical protein
VRILVITDGSSIAPMILRVALRFGHCSTSMPNATLAHDRTGSRTASDRRSLSRRLAPEAATVSSL